MSVSFGHSGWLILPGLLVAAALSVWLYRHTIPHLPVWKRVALATLRGTALTTLVLLLLEPAIRKLTTEVKAPVLALLLDNSSSIAIGSGSSATDTLDVAGKRRLIGALPVDKIGGEVKVYTFDSKVSKGSGVLNADSIQFDGQRTDIAFALDALRDRMEVDNVRSVLLVSDGRYNTGGNPVYVAERYPVPIHTLTVGDTSAVRDVRVSRTVTNQLAYVGAELPIRATVRTEGVKGERIEIAVVVDGEVVDSRWVDVESPASEHSVDLVYVPDSVGVMRLSVAATRIADEVTYRNNVDEITIRVLSNKRRILLLAAGPDPDVSALRQVLDQNDDFDLDQRTQKSAASFYEGNELPPLNDYDLIILAGYPGNTARRDIVAAVATAAAQGTPVVYFLTRKSNAVLYRDVLGDVLPVSPAVVRPGFLDAGVSLTAASTRHPVLDGVVQGANPWNLLPPLAVPQNRWTVAPDARVLATQSIRGIEINEPLLVVRNRAGRRSAALLGSGYWRWHNLPGDLDQYRDVWPRLVQNLVQWTASREDDRPVRVRPVANTFTGNDPVELVGQVYDENVMAVSDATVSVTITAPDGNAFPFTMEPAGNGRYVLRAGSLPAGAYSFKADARDGDRNFGSDAGQFVVGELRLEFRETRADPGLMRQISARSGGQSLTPDLVENLPGIVSASPLFVAAEEVSEDLLELWRNFGFALFVIGLVTTEWVIRKRSGLV